MRKFLFLLMVLLILVFSALPAGATSVEELTDLARYYPVNAPMFASMRIDDEFIDTLDTIAQDVDAKLGGMMGGMTLRDGLDMIAMELDPEADFESAFGWAGDTVAVGIIDPENPVRLDNSQEEPTVIAVSVADARAAELFLDNLIGAAYDKTDTNAGGILYNPPEPDADMPTIYLAEDVLLLRPSSLVSETLVPVFDASLADNPQFEETMARLPLDDYNAVLYFHPIMARTAIEEAQMELSDLPVDINLTDMFTALGPQSAGFTILDGRNFVMDMAIHVQDMTALQVALGTGNIYATYEPIDVEFLSNLPANTALFSQGTNFGQQVLASFAAWEEMGDLYDERYETGALSYDEEDLRYLDEGAVFLRQSFEGLTGLTLEEAFGSLTGDYVAYLNILPSSFEEIPVLPDFGMMIDINNSDSSALVSALPNLLYDLGVDYEEEEGLLVVPLLGDLVGDNALDMLMGEQDGLLVSGTRSGISAIGSDSMADSDAFQNASQYFVEGAQSLAYINFAPLNDIVGSLAQMGDPDMQELALILPLLESASATVTMDESGSGQVRLIISLGQ